MTLRRALMLIVLAAVPGALLLRPVEVNPITPSIEVNQAKVPVGSAIEITYAWSLEPGARRLEQDYRALVRFVDDQDVTLFDDDHAPVPPSSAWQPGQTYRYTRTAFVPVCPYTGEVEVRMGLYPLPGRGERPVLKGVDRGSREYGVARIELRPQTENVYLYYKEGWYTPEKVPENPTVDRQWTKKEAVVAFRNPNLKREKPTDVIVYLRGNTCVKCSPRDPTLTVSVANRVGLRFLIDGPQERLFKIRVGAKDLGSEEWTDLRLALDQSFVPRDLYPPLNNDERELGFSVSHLSVAEAARAGSPEGVVDAVPLDPPFPRGPSAPRGP
jgi:hypothetical protein